MTINKIAVIGSGYMGGGIAQVLALGGAQVVLGDVDANTARQSLERLLKQADAFAEAGLFPADARARLEARLSAAASIEEAVEGVDYVTEAVPESMEIKRDVLQRICKACAPDTLIGTNTSAMPIGELAKFVSHPQRFLGVHWMNPAPFIPSVELIASEHTLPEHLDTLEALMRSVGKVPARVADAPGFVANRLQFALYKEAVLVVEEGLATPEQVDLVVSNAFGFRLALFGPFAIGDMAGLDVYASSYKTLAASYGERFAAPASLSELVDNGNLGLKAGHGYLDIDPAKRAELLAYRDKAYAALARLREELGPAPGLAS
jgi:3-hydroxybutyryl-CoA dehydrogenase